jgi:hypothetical protein
MLSFASKCFLREEQSFKFLSKLFQIWTALYANDRWPAAVLNRGIWRESCVRVLRSWIVTFLSICYKGSRMLGYSHIDDSKVQQILTLPVVCVHFLSGPKLDAIKGGGGGFAYSYIRVLPYWFLLKAIVFTVCEHEYMHHPQLSRLVMALFSVLYFLFWMSRLAKQTNKYINNHALLPRLQSWSTSHSIFF